MRDPFEYSMALGKVCIMVCKLYLILVQGIEWQVSPE